MHRSRNDSPARLTVASSRTSECLGTVLAALPTVNEPGTQPTAASTVRVDDCAILPTCASPASAWTVSSCPSTRRSRPRGTPFRAARSRRRSSGSRPTRASSASDRATRWTASRPSSTCSSAATRWRSPTTSASSRRSTSTPAATGRSRSRCGTSSARSRDSRSRPSSVAPRRASRPMPRAGCCWLRRPGPNRRCACATRGSARSRSGSIRAGSRRASPRWRRPAHAVGDSMAIMVDLNQGWRMAGDTTPSLDPVAARAIALQLAEYDVLWLEEPLAGTDLRGLAALRASGTGVRIAGGEMTRTFSELLAAVEADAFDVHQPDVVLAAGMLRGRAIAELAHARNRWYTPHTWSNGIGLLANLHVAAGVGGGTVHRVPVRPARLDPRTPRLHARRTDRPVPTGSCASRRRPGSGSSSTRPRSSGSRPDARAVPRLAGPRREGYTRRSETRSHSL